MLVAYGAALLNECPLIATTRSVSASAWHEDEHSTPRLPSAGAAGARIVRHEKERRKAGPTFASGPAPRQRDGRGH